MATAQQKANQVLKNLKNFRVTANRNIFVPDIMAPGFGKIIVLFNPSTEGNLTAVINGVSGSLYCGEKIPPNIWNVFELPTYPNMAINFRFSANATVSMIVIYQSE